MHAYLRLDELTFEERYRPIRDRQGAWVDFDWTDPVDGRAIERARAERRIWTSLDVDGFVIVATGYHFVNRLGYVITEESVAPNLEVEVFDREELEEWRERVQAAEELGSETP